MGLELGSDIFPTPAIGSLLLSQIRLSASSLLPYPVRDLLLVDGAATLIGYYLLDQFDNSLTVAIRSPGSAQLTAPAQAILTRAVGYATQSMDISLFNEPDEIFLAISHGAKKWADRTCGMEYGSIALTRAASDLIASNQTDEPMGINKKLASTLYLVALED